MSMLEHSLNLLQLSHTLTLNLILTLIKLKFDFFVKINLWQNYGKYRKKDII